MPDRPAASSDHVRRRMERQRRRDTEPELLLRRALFASGKRYRVNYPVPGIGRRTIDIAFPRQKMAVFVDGCFWHSCPLHGVQPKNAPGWWEAKLAGNVTRDRDTDAHLASLGWRVIRVWEHEALDHVVARVLNEVGVVPHPGREKL